MIVDVAVPCGLNRTFHYLLDPEQANSFELGSVLEVPFRTRTVHGFVLGFLESTSVDHEKLKSVGPVLVGEPVFSESDLKFYRWISDYYCHPLGEVIATAIPKLVFRKRKRRKAIDALCIPSEGLRHQLNDEQAFAVSRIRETTPDQPVLLHGVTGSGKTEVYMNLIAETVESGRGAIVLVPEIALTPQLLNRFLGRFGDRVGMLHSSLTDAERYQQWQGIRSGKYSIAVGPRSAIFAPVRNLGLIIVDEEHEGSFKQEDSLRYHARDMAIVRAKFTRSKIVLGSATPSLESYSHAQSGKYLYVTLKNRIENRPLPKVTFVDLKDNSERYSDEFPWFSQTLIRKLRETLHQKQQAILYLNRLGFAHFLFCKDCGHTWRCRNCEVALTYYKVPPRLQCHYCGVIETGPSACSECAGVRVESLGLGTEQVEEALSQIFPEARTARFDRSQVKTRKDLENILDRITRRDIDIVVGTQMVAKGHDFPGISLVGILVADASLNIPDFRSHERTFQILTQVSGRAGRAEIPGEVVVQTVNPRHPVLLAAAENRANDFYRIEIETRRVYQFPPFARMAMVKVQHTQLDRVKRHSEALVAFARKEIERKQLKVVILGPSEAPLARIKNKFRWQFMLKSQSVRDLHAILVRLQEYEIFNKTPVRMAVDVDPVNPM